MVSPTSSPSFSAVLPTSRPSASVTLDSSLCHKQATILFFPDPLQMLFPLFGETSWSIHSFINK